ncbi:unnamed protein product [Gordionus sp. m RMFG-2023]
MEDLISSSSGSEVDFESDDDYLYNSNHNSETEEDNIDSDVCEDSYKYCYSKDGKTKWNMECPTQKRTRSHNIISSAQCNGNDKCSDCNYDNDEPPSPKIQVPVPIQSCGGSCGNNRKDVVNNIPFPKQGPDGVGKRQGCGSSCGNNGNDVVKNIRFPSQGPGGIGKRRKRYILNIYQLI